MEMRHPASAPRLVGIDLGTTNSVVAYLDSAGVPSSVVNFEGDIATPSKLLIEGAAVLVGREAAKAARTHGGNYAEAFKRYMGEDLFPKPLAGRRWRPEELSALVLRRLKQDAERRLGRVESAVIAVPAYFDESRRRATYNAAAIAGWNAVDLINEPTAAAIAYAYRADGSAVGQRDVEHILVFDLGGGTMDATLLRVLHGREYRTVATDGEVQLGGLDWDARLRDHLAEQFRAQTGTDPLGTPQGQLELLQVAEHAKRSLSVKQVVQVPCLLAGRRVCVPVTRATFESLTRDLVERTRATAELVLEQGKMKWSQIDTVLMCGGSTRMPMVRRMLRELTGKEPYRSLSVDEAVAHGAAVYARVRDTASGIRVINVNSHTYRILAAPRGKPPIAYPMIAKNSPLPASGKHVFRTKAAGQDSCCIAVYDGEAIAPELCSQIGKVVVGDLAAAGPKRWYVKVKLTCIEDGKLTVAATIHDPDNPAKVVRRASAALVSTHGMTDQDVQRARELLASFSIT